MRRGFLAAALLAASLVICPLARAQSPEVETHPDAVAVKFTKTVATGDVTEYMVTQLLSGKSWLRVKWGGVATNLYSSYPLPQKDGYTLERMEVTNSTIVTVTYRDRRYGSFAQPPLKLVINLGPKPKLGDPITLTQPLTAELDTSVQATTASTPQRQARSAATTPRKVKSTLAHPAPHFTYDPPYHDLHPTLVDDYQGPQVHRVIQNY